MSTPLSELIPSLRETVFKHLKSYLGGEGELSSIMDSLEFWYDRLRDKEHPDLPMWQDLPSNEQDQLFDAWHAALEDFFRQRLTQSDPETSSRLFKPVVDPCPDCGLVGAHFCTRGMPLIDCPECGAHGPHVCITGGFVPGVSSPSPASSVVPAPLVPDAVKVAQDGSVCEVEPLGEVAIGGYGNEEIDFTDEYESKCSLVNLGDYFGVGIKNEFMELSPSQSVNFVHTLTTWLATGSFDLKGLPSSPPSSEDTELLDWLEDDKGWYVGIENDYHERDETDPHALWKVNKWVGEDSCVSGTGTTLRGALRIAMKLDQQASTTPQKGGQGV